MRQSLAMRAWKQEEGAAVTETAVMMFIMIPLTLFVMFTSDAVYHLLEVQEAVIATVWDFSVADYGSSKEPGKAAGTWSGIEGTTSGMNRLQYADHDGSFTNEQRITASMKFSEDGHMLHHNQAFGHVCWCNGPSDCGGTSAYNDNNRSQQIRCRISRGGSADSFSLDFLGGTSRFRDNWQAGGTVECWAKGWLYNYLIGEKFIADFPAAEKIPLFNKKRRTADSIHQNQNQTATADILLRYRAALLVDSWAITTGAKTDLADTDSAFYQRSNTVFTNIMWYGPAIAGVMGYAGQARSKQCGNVVAAPTNIPGMSGIVGPKIPQFLPELIAFPNPLGLWMVTKYGSSVGAYKNDKFHTTPLYDDFGRAFNNRGMYYLGSRRSQTR